MSEEPAARPDRASAEHGARSERGSVTRGFLFVDLRGYTTFVERHGAAVAAELLGRYRPLVRAEIDRFDGTEILTEGDSFYVVFGSVSAAVSCGLALAAAAAEESRGRPDQPIRLGIGIHAGETVKTVEGYVGGAVNIAARLCALAGPGELLVSDTVRALTHTVLLVRFVARGRRHLKGVAEPVLVFAVESIEPLAGSWGGTRRDRRSRAMRLVPVVGAAVIAAGLAGFVSLLTRPAALPPGEWTIGLALPLGGDYSTEAQPLELAVRLAMDEANAAGGVASTELGLEVLDHGSEPSTAEFAPATDSATAFVADPRVVAVVGPMLSIAAEQQIPITNEAGLLQCSPSATDPILTKPEIGALGLRSAYPERINFVRLAAADDIEAYAAASFAFHDLGVRSVLVVDDTLSIGRRVADDFEQEFEDLGGQTERRALNPGAEPATVLAPLDVGTDPATLVYFGGFTGTGATELRRAMIDAGHADLPFMAWEGLFDGSGADEFSFIRSAGDAATGSYVSLPSTGTVRADFEERYRAAYDAAPEGYLAHYAGAAYACTEIIVEALARVSETRPTAANLREAVRAYVTDTAHRFRTVLGATGFDANGDSIHQVVAFYRVDPSAADGDGDWVVVKEQDFGSAE
ncbi:MAG: ABC transporter substrate-binding protein [Candidatus Limnocylindria bacterium]